MTDFFIACLVASIPLALAAGLLWGYATGYEKGRRRRDEDEHVRHWRERPDPAWYPDPVSRDEGEKTRQWRYTNRTDQVQFVDPSSMYHPVENDLGWPGYSTQRRPDDPGSER